MTDTRGHSGEQLTLFAGPATPTAAPARRTPARRRRRFRIPVTLLAIGVATAGVFAGSFAAWTAQSSNPTNAVTTGRLSLSNNKQASAVFAASNVKPGDTGSSTVTLTNDGTIPVAVRLTQDQVSSSGVEASLGLKVHDATRNWCYYPVSQAGPCPAAFGAWKSSLANLQLRSVSGATHWPAGESHTFTLSWQLALSSPNSDQGKTGSFRLVWDGTQ